jgi:acyl dehydratase
MNAAAEGKAYEPVAFEVSKARVDAFHRMFGGPPGVPPTLLTAAEFSVFPSIIGDPDLGLDFSRVVHGSQEYEYRRPLQIGETLSVEARIASIRQKGGNGFLTIEMQMRDSNGAVAATSRSTMIERGSAA